MKGALFIKSKTHKEPHDLHRSKIILDQFLKSIDISEIPLLIEQLEWAYKENPFEGLKIYHCTPLDLITAIKISVLHLGGANVVVTHSRFANPKQKEKGIQLLECLGIEYRPSQQVHRDEIFDIYMDNGAELIDKPPPLLGYIEMTRSGEIIYEKNKLSAPVISINKSVLKKIETSFGTADGCFRALEKLFKDQYKGKRYVLLGYGNVGFSIAQKLTKVAKQVTIIEICPHAIVKAQSEGFQTCLLSQITKCKEIISDADFMITATGEKGIVSRVFSDSIDLFRNKILINMGGNDEYGPLFSKDSVINQKESFNFVLDLPTSWKYLDPVFYAHNQAIKLLQNQTLPKQVHPFPEELDTAIYLRWKKAKN